MTKTTSSRDIDVGELNIRHINRELGLVRSESSETHRILVERVIPMLSAICDRLGVVEYTTDALKSMPPDAPRPPTIPWRLFATVVAASITAAGLVLGGVYILGAP